jgi:hypothetical protein
MGHYASEMSSTWRESIDRNDRLERLQRAFAKKDLGTFSAEDLNWLIPLMEGYPANECLYEEILQKLEHRCEVNGWWARQDSKRKRR